jgi:HSP20 family molecular chaperone IbpA
MARCRAPGHEEETRGEGSLGSHTEILAMRKEKGTGASPGEETGIPYRLIPDGDRIRIIADLPGVSEEWIRLDLEKKTLFISVTNRERSHRVSITLPFVARLGTKKFSKGVLELTLERSGH